MFGEGVGQFGVFLVQAVERFDQVVARVNLQVKINHAEKTLSLISLNEIRLDEMSNSAHIRGRDDARVSLELGGDLHRAP